MPDDPATPNTIKAAVRNRSVAQGDVPESLRRRYYVDGRGGAGLGFYVDAKVDKPAFRDEGKRLATARADPSAIRDMTLVAQHRGWTIVSVHGSSEFRREAWLAGRANGIEVRGYRPTERDIQELDRRIDRRLATDARRERRQRTEEEQPDVRSVDERGRDQRQTGRDQLRVVEAVVRARVAGADGQERILATARKRLADWLERGARLQPMAIRQDREAAAEPRHGRERSRVR